MNDAQPSPELGIAPAAIEALRDSPRVVICGGPSSGKTTLARLAGARFKRDVRHADALVSTHEWSEASAAVALWFDHAGEWIVEGVATARALRKWLAANGDRKLDATVVLLPHALQPLTKGQAAMAKGVATVWNGIATDLLASGVKIQTIKL